MGTVDILIKVYFKTEEFNGGRMTNYLNNLKEGDEIDVRGPFGKFQYLGNGEVKILVKFKPQEYFCHKFKKIIMVAGGTGITPIYQILQCAEKNKEKGCEFYLIYSNHTENDILLKNELIQISKVINLKLVFILTKIDGRISRKNFDEILPEKDKDSMILHCGPRGFCDSVIKIMKEIDQYPINVFEF